MTTNTDTGEAVYYYRGNVDNHLIFANFCWRIVRTTETGGVKLIYEGVPQNGQCNNNYGSIGSSAFNSTSNDAKYVGYMYGSSIDDEIYTDDSTIKKTIDTWYKTKMTSYTSQLEDTVFCNDRSYNTIESDIDLELYFGAYTRLSIDKTPTLKCQNARDKFTVNTSNGNGKLTYPVGLITADEVMYAGGTNSNSSFYLYTGQIHCTMTPAFYMFLQGIYRSMVIALESNGKIMQTIVNANCGVRPVISLQPGTSISGAGTAESPFIIE